MSGHSLGYISIAERWLRWLKLVVDNVVDAVVAVV